VDAAEGRARQRQLGLRERAGDAEVEQADAAGAVEDDVRGLHVAVHDAARVCRREPVEDALRDPRGDVRRQVATLAEHRREVFAVDELHDDERTRVFGSVVEDIDDVRVVERGRGLRLLAEAGHERGVAPVFRPQHLDGDVAVESRIACAVHRRHAALAEQLDEPVTPAEETVGAGRAARAQLRSRPAR
jgi:hypothetical protein